MSSSVVKTDSAPLPAGSDAKSKSKVPEWMKPEIFHKALHQMFGANFANVTNSKIVSALPPGENYTTLILRADFDVELKTGQRRTASFIIKTMQSAGPMDAMLKNVFKIEREMYSSVLPELEQMYRDAGLEVKFGARVFDLETEELHLAMENLCTLSFKNVKRQLGLDLEHTKESLIKLAQWHAVTATRVARIGRYPHDIEVGSLKEETKEISKQMTAIPAATFKQCLSTFNGHELYEEAVAKLHPQLMDLLYKGALVDSAEFNVLNHGDYWCNNIMFREDAFGKIKETRLVDFQAPRFGMPAQDLYYFLLSSTCYENKLSKFDFFIKFYHDSLVEHLRLLKYPKPVPTLKELHIQLHKQAYWGFLTATTTMAGVLVDPNDSASIGDVMNQTEGGNNFLKLLYSNDSYRKHAEAVFPWLLYRGALEC